MFLLIFNLDNLNHFQMGPLKMSATLKWWPHQKFEILHKYGPMSDNFFTLNFIEYTTFVQVNNYQ